jgi:ABC-type transport system involved in multi-copper enzyme maturation permease subunit
MNLWALLRYNFRVLMLGNWWLLVFPVAVSQLSVFWNVTTQVSAQTNAQWLAIPAQTLERITPLLAAFLGAHLLSAEYRSRVGAVLASRPVNIGKIVVMRLAVMLALVWGLGWISIQAYMTWVQPFDSTPVYEACIPSTLFLTMLSLTFATLFRNSLAGFGIAAIYWALDLPPGAPLNPYLSLQSLTSYYTVIADQERHAMISSWAISKVILLTGALLLYLYHSRLVFSLGSPQTVRNRRRALLAFAGFVLFYLVSGAAVKVNYGYKHRGSLPPNDLIWFRYQFASYGPIPVARLFGPAFTRYLGEFKNPWRVEQEEGDRFGDTAEHRRALREIVETMPGSIWAASAADALARLESRGQQTIEGAVAPFQRVVSDYPNSPYVDSALRQIAIRHNDAGNVREARATYEELLKRFPNSRFRRDAERYLREQPAP